MLGINNKKSAEVQKTVVRTHLRIYELTSVPISIGVKNTYKADL